MFKPDKDLESGVEILGSTVRQKLPPLQTICSSYRGRDPKMLAAVHGVAIPICSIVLSFLYFCRDSSARLTRKLGCCGEKLPHMPPKQLLPWGAGNSSSMKRFHPSTVMSSSCALASIPRAIIRTVKISFFILSSRLGSTVVLCLATILVSSISFADITYLGPLSTTVDSTTLSGDVVFPSDGLAVVAAAGYRGLFRSINSIAIGSGGNATLVVQATDSFQPRAIGAKAITAGTHTVTVTFSATMLNSAAGVYLITGYDSATPSDTDVPTVVTATSLNYTQTFPTNGYGIYNHIHINSEATTWSDAGKDYDTALESIRYSFAHKTATGVDNVETASQTSSVVTAGLSAVWTPLTGVPTRNRKYH